MATPINYSNAGLHDIARQWFDGLASDKPEAKLAKNALDQQNYSGKKDAKGKVLAPDHHSEGVALYNAFRASDGTRTTAKPARRDKVNDAKAAEKRLRTWVRQTHWLVGGIQVHAAGADLVRLPGLGELDTFGGLQATAKDLIAYVSSPALAPSLVKYNITAEDGKAGQKLLDTWDAARVGADIERGGEQGALHQHVADRKALVAWLSVWWKIAKVRLKGQPAALALLGIETGTRRRRGPKGGGGGTPV
ncbi:MAG: hypothetical protein FJ100_10675 [Deltaproteobacteria bacterium]|nr:hypothetical protein [Deltaproteobacteria bacterium]